MATDYSAYTDNELLELFHAGNGDAGSELALRYRPLIKRCTRPYFLVGGDSEDLIQEGMIGLVSSMQSYRADSGALFKTYAELCIRRRILSAIKAASRFKHMPMNYRLSLEELYADAPEELDALPGEGYNRSPEELVLERETKSALYSLCRAILSPLEKRVLSYYLDGLSYEEIAARCNKPVKSVDSALQRIKRKLNRAVTREEKGLTPEKNEQHNKRQQHK